MLICFFKYTLFSKDIKNGRERSTQTRRNLNSKTIYFFISLGFHFLNFPSGLQQKINK